MICMSRTDGSVTAGGNTLIMWTFVFTFLRLFTFRSFDISSGNGSVPFQDSDLFWAVWPAVDLSVLRVAEKSVNPLTPCDNHWTFLCGLGWVFFILNNISVKETTWMVMVLNVQRKNIFGKRSHQELLWILSTQRLTYSLRSSRPVCVPINHTRPL